MKKPLIVIGVGLFLVIITIKKFIFILPEGRQAIVTEFGKPVGDPKTEAGLHFFSKPFIQDVRYVDKRILNWDGDPNQIPTKDKKFIKVDTTARFRIVNALTFIETVRDKRGAKARLDKILDSATRNVISGHNLVEAVRDSNRIIDINKEKEEAAKNNTEEVIEEEITGEIEEIFVGREKLSQLIVEKADKELGELGIELIDVQLKRISYEKSVETKVYERMISERQRIASKIRSIGSGERAKIEGRLEKDLRRIKSEGYRRAQEIKGKAEAKAAKIYANTYNKDPKFYEFMKSMDVYKKVIKNGDSKVITTTDSEFFKFLK
ncbi:MAG: protease modulator HflC [Bdellovibrionota bacterium]|nr:protease modulator HflC [Bdellovibrionota bacterium]